MVSGLFKTDKSWITVNFDFSFIAFQCRYLFIWVQMNVVPRSTGNTNNGTRELTLKCKLKCYFKPMNNPLGVSPSKGKQGTTRGKEKIF